MSLLPYFADFTSVSFDQAEIAEASMDGKSELAKLLSSYPEIVRLRKKADAAASLETHFERQLQELVDTHELWCSGPITELEDDDGIVIGRCCYSCDFDIYFGNNGLEYEERLLYPGRKAQEAVLAVFDRARKKRTLPYREIIKRTHLSEEEVEEAVAQLFNNDRLEYGDGPGDDDYYQRVAES